jgi:hypothetical protein
MRALLQFKTFEHAAAHLLCRLGWRLPTSQPQSMVNVLTPNVAVEEIEGIVVPGNRFNRGDGKPIISRLL